MILLLNIFASSLTAQTVYSEPHRPQMHFSPRAHWMNDPNGMVYNDGIYHLFFQYYPDSSVWGPMHWGHAISTDLIHWQEQPIALYPDSIGYIFSGSAVIDKNNTSGFGRNGQIPMVAIYTNHNVQAERSGSTDVQKQSIAYSLDNGKTWTKYAGNPVIKNPGIVDFRDPKVMWYEEGKKWVMILAVKDHVSFYSSPNLKNWTKESEFGQNAGAHGGVWECPDIFNLTDAGKRVWILTVSVNPGGPNGGSATQYFIGDFDGNKFITSDTSTKWIDYGTDNYAGVTWSNTGERRIFLGWMSNWSYALVVPTVTWRSAMTIPRELKLTHVGNNTFLTSQPVPELNKITSTPVILKDVQPGDNFDLSAKTGKITLPARIDIDFENSTDFSLTLSNDMSEQVVIGYDEEKTQYFIDRTRSGKVDFSKDFPAKHVAPRLATSANMRIALVIDVSSVELFADDGLTVMTDIFFPSKPYDKITIQSADKIIKKISYLDLKSIWHN